MLHQIQSVAINILTIVGAAINALIAKKKGSSVKTNGEKILGIGLYAKRKAPAFAGAFVGNTFFLGLGKRSSQPAHQSGDCCRRLRPCGIKKKDIHSDVLVLALPIFTARHQATIVGVSELNFCVRDGYRWTLTTIITNSHRIGF